MKNGQKHIIKAKKEIILSGGAINSPQLLMLSGIGPQDHLKSLGVCTYIVSVLHYRLFILLQLREFVSVSLLDQKVNKVHIFTN